MPFRHEARLSTWCRNNWLRICNIAVAWYRQFRFGCFWQIFKSKIFIGMLRHRKPQLMSYIFELWWQFCIFDEDWWRSLRFLCQNLVFVDRLGGKIVWAIWNFSIIFPTRVPRMKYNIFIQCFITDMSTITHRSQLSSPFCASIEINKFPISGISHRNNSMYFVFVITSNLVCIENCIYFFCHWSTSQIS